MEFKHVCKRNYVISNWGGAESMNKNVLENTCQLLLEQDH